MAGPVWGRAEIIVDVNGDRIVGQIRRLGTAAGRSAGEAAGKSFDRSFSRALRDSDSFKGLTPKMKGFRGELNRLSQGWRGLSHNTRQWTLIIGAIAAALPQLSVLSSALSGTIVALGAAFVGLAAGVGLAVAGFIGLFEEGTKLEAGARRAKAAFEELGTAFGELQTGIVNAMFADMASSIRGLTDTLLPALTDGILSFAENVGANIGRVFEALASPVAIENFQALLQGFKPIFDNLTTAVIGFGGALGGILVAALPLAKEFTAAIADVATQFSTWANSEAGRDRLTEFFETASTLMGPLIGLVADLGKMLAALVTPQTIASTVTLIESIRGFIPILQGAFQILAGLNIFGVVAAALDAIGGALAPLLPTLISFAGVLGDQIMVLIEELTPVFERLGVALAPVLEKLGELLAAILPPLVDAIVAVVDVVVTIIEVLVAFDSAIRENSDGLEVWQAVVTGVLKVIVGLFTNTFTMIGGFLKSIIALLKGDTAGAFKILEDTARAMFKNLGLDFDKFTRWVTELAVNVAKFFGQIGRAFSDFGRTVANAIGGAIDWVNRLIGAIGRLDFGAIGNLFSGGGGGFASGGVLLGPRRILAGEAGPEAIVPLNRSLSMVDPSVRWLSAIAQGFHTPAMAGGGVVAGRSTLVENINVYQTGNPQRVAMDVVNRLAERVAA